jgi:hypothetical protein
MQSADSCLKKMPYGLLVFAYELTIGSKGRGLEAKIMSYPKLRRSHVQDRLATARAYNDKCNEFYPRHKSWRACCVVLIVQQSYQFYNPTLDCF